MRSMIIVYLLAASALGTSVLTANELPQALQGEWKLREIHQQDRVAKIEHDNSGCVIKGDQLTLNAGKIRQNYQIEVDPTTTPPQLNAALKTDQGTDISPAIYNLTGDRLTICFALPGKPRPEGFSAHIGEPHFMWVFTRKIEKPPFTDSTTLTPGQMKRLKAASDHLQGTWEIVSMEWDGRQYPGEVTGRIVIQGDKATSFGGKKPVTYSLEIDPGRKPAQLNMLMSVEGELQIKQCIYKIENDELILCHHFKSNRARPTEFKTQASDGLLLTRLRRQTIQQTGN